MEMVKIVAISLDATVEETARVLNAAHQDGYCFHSTWVAGDSLRAAFKWSKDVLDAQVREARVAEKQERAATRAREEAIAFGLIKSHPKLSNWEVSALLKRHGVQRSPEWCRLKRVDLVGR